MITLMIYDSDQKESKYLVEQSQNAIAHQSDDYLEVSCFHKVSDARTEMEKGKLMDAAFLDVTAPEGIPFSRQVRQNNEMAQLLVIADIHINPMRYMIPDIRAASLLLRPFTPEVSQTVISQFFQSVYREEQNSQQEKKLIIENRDGRISIPYSKIYYLEVSGKKVYVRLKEKEYSRYDTMDNIIKQLPTHFLRCHRSFVVNTQYITKVKLSENTIYLEDDMMVPLARSYKADIKEFMKNHE